MSNTFDNPPIDSNNDWAIAIMIGSDFSEQLPKDSFQKMLLVPAYPTPNLFQKLKPPFQSSTNPHGDWLKIIQVLKHELDSAQAQLQGALHVYFEGPSPLALYTGCLIASKLRNKPIYIYQQHPKSTEWHCFWTPPPVDLTGCPSYFVNRPTQVEHEGAGSGIALAVSCGRHITPEQVTDLARRTGVGQAFILSSPGSTRTKRFINSTPMAWKAREQAIEALRKLESEHAGATLHLCSTAPAAFLIALGLEMAEGIFRQVIMHDWNTQFQRYQSVLEVMKGEPVLGATRRTLLIEENEGSIIYSLNGEVLPCARPILKAAPDTSDPSKHRFGLHPDAIPFIYGTEPFLLPVHRGFAPNTAKNNDLHPFYDSVRHHNHFMLPDTVKTELQDLRNDENLDIEVQLKGDTALLDWTYLDIGENLSPKFAARMPGWSVHLTDPSSQTKKAQRKAIYPKPVDVKELRILFVASMRSTDEVYEWVKFEALAKAVRAFGAQVTIIPADSTLPKIESTLKSVKPDIIHWLGHGSAESEGQWSEVAQAFGDDVPNNHLDRQRLVNLLTANKPRLICFCSCSIGTPGPDYGVPHHLLRRGVHAVLGFRSRVLASEAKAFFDTFYPSLLRGDTLRVATQKARASLNCARRPGAFGLATLSVKGNYALEEIVYPSEESKIKSNPILTPSECNDPEDNAKIDDGGIGATSGNGGDGDGRSSQPKVFGKVHAFVDPVVLPTTNQRPGDGGIGATSGNGGDGDGADGSDGSGG